MAWPCFWLVPSGRVALGLRRYTPLGGRHEWSCADGWHEAFTWRGLEAGERWETHDGRLTHPPAAAVDHADPAWPAQCAAGCGYAFTGADTWQEWEEPLWHHNGQLEVLHTGWPPPPGCAHAGPGAMWDGANWLPESWVGPDGIGLIVRCPAPGAARPHDWIVDSPSTSGGRWARTGDPRNPPTLTVTPSIAIGHPGASGYYHGFLAAGQLTDPI